LPLRLGFVGRPRRPLALQPRLKLDAVRKRTNERVSRHKPTFDARPKRRSEPAAPLRLKLKDRTRLMRDLYQNLRERERTPHIPRRPRRNQSRRRKRRCRPEKQVYRANLRTDPPGERELLVTAHRLEDRQYRDIHPHPDPRRPAVVKPMQAGTVPYLSNCVSSSNMVTTAA
jgi:hypothetical protein